VGEGGWLFLHDEPSLVFLYRMMMAKENSQGSKCQGRPRNKHANSLGERMSASSRNATHQKDKKLVVGAVGV